MRFSITIPSLPPKEFSPNWRGHWAVRGKAANAAYDEVIALVAEQGWNNIPLDAAHITVSWGVKDRIRRDTDNFVGRTKPYIDGLVKAQVIADDSRLHVVYTYRWHNAASSETVITIEGEEGEDNG